MKDERMKYIVPLDDGRCVAVRIRSCIVYCYPVCREVLEYGPKVMTRSGKVVRQVQYTEDGGLTGLLDGERMFWDSEGRFGGEDANPLTLCVPERYFDVLWKDRIKMSNSEWALKYQARHGTVEVPKELSEKRKFRREE